MHIRASASANRIDQARSLASRLGETVDDLGDLGLVVGSAVSVEAGALGAGGLVEHAEELRHFSEGGVLRGSGTDNLEASADRCTGCTVHGIGLFGLTQTLFARLVLRHLKISG